MASYLILGAGKFGLLALRRLSRQDRAARFILVDQEPEALAAARAPEFPEAQMIEGEAVSFLLAHPGSGSSWDWLIPMVPLHLAYDWLISGPLAGKGWEPYRVPEELGSLVAHSIPGPEGELYLSMARRHCPDDCPEPSVCPVTGEERHEPLFARLAEASRPELPILVVASEQLAPGVGGFSPLRLMELAETVAKATGPVLVATACRCHGVVHGLKRQGERSD